MPIPPTDREIIGMCVLTVLLFGFLVYAWIRGKREEERTVTWIRDWEEYPRGKRYR